MAEKAEKRVLAVGRSHPFLGDLRVLVMLYEIDGRIWYDITPSNLEEPK